MTNRYCYLPASGNEMECSSILFDICLLLYVRSWTQDVGQKDRPKLVECYSKIKFEKLVHLVGFTIEMWFLKLGHIHHSTYFSINCSLIMLPLGAIEPQLLTTLWGGNHLGFPLAFLLQHIYSVFCCNSYAINQCGCIWSVLVLTTLVVLLKDQTYISIHSVCLAYCDAKWILKLW